MPLEEIPDHLIKATLATEDRRFFEHFGVDFIGTARALFENARANEVVQGGSTITQQLAKNLFLSSERSLTRKIKEAFLAFLLESRFTKRQILKLYLDRAYLGGGAFGVEAASQFYFGKSVREINLAEAALIAGLFKAPSQVCPARQPAGLARAHQRRAHQPRRGRLHERRPGACRPAQPGQVSSRRGSTHSPDWFLDWAFEEVQRLGEGRGHYVLTARTTVDLGMQQAAQDAMINTLRYTGPSAQARLYRRHGVDGARRRRARAWSAAWTTRTTSSTAPPTPAASRAPPSSSTSTPRPSRTATTRARSCATTAAPAATGRRRNYTGGVARAGR